MLYVPPPTRYDLKWRMFGIPVRVHPMFWLLAALLGWNSEMPKLTILVWMPCVLVSVVVHELGHALTARRFGGGQPQIVLHFMGLATSGALAQSRERIIHILAGPGAGLIVATIVAPLFFLQPIDNFWVIAYIHTMFMINLVWSLVNLVPILPLDGGQLTKELIARKRPAGSLYRTARLSIIFAIIAAVICLVCAIVFRSGSWFFGVMMAGLLIFYNVQMRRYGSMIERENLDTPRQSWEKDPDWWR
ncbi:MAG: M50 family metallopeptidase [Lentisphaeria bacterium]|jgi:Zn-dependent protease